MYNNMNELLTNSIIIGVLASFIIVLAKKWGIVEQMQVHGNDFFSAMANCDFCLSWWVCVVLTAIYIIATGDVDMAVMPFLGTMVSRFLL